MGSTDSVEFFGVKLKVNNPRLAALLNSDVTDDVVVVGQRARDLMALGADEMVVEPDEGAGATCPPADAGRGPAD